MSTEDGESIEFLQKVKIAYIKEVEKRIDSSIADDVPAEIYIGALGNQLIRNCNGLKVSKERFLDVLSKAWDYHSGNEKANKKKDKKPKGKE